MDQQQLTALQNWFNGYCAAFAMPVPEEQRNIAIKQNHTREVCANAVRITTELKLACEEVLIAEAISLFHDVGRFPQYQQYKTFDDSVSVNHAALGARVLLEAGVLLALGQKERDLIIRSILLHNVFVLPEVPDEQSLLHARIVRDADKLDIMRVVIEYFTQDTGSRAEAVAIGLPDVPGMYTPAVLACLMRGEMAKKSLLATLNDFKLLQLMWLYDLNFASSLRLVEERDYIGKIEALLPETTEIRAAVQHVRNFVAGRAEAS